MIHFFICYIFNYFHEYNIYIYTFIVHKSHNQIPTIEHEMKSNPICCFNKNEPLKIGQHFTSEG